MSRMVCYIAVLLASSCLLLGASAQIQQIGNSLNYTTPVTMPMGAGMSFYVEVYAAVHAD